MRKQMGLGLFLEKLEAKIFIAVENRLVDLGCLSVHDSLYFKKSLFDMVKTELDKEFTKNNFRNYKLK